MGAIRRETSLLIRIGRLSSCILGSVALLVLFGCATRIPGGDLTYCTDTNRSERLNSQFEYAFFEYGQFKEEPISANSGICSFLEFYELRIWWKHYDGDERERRVDVGELINDLKEREKGWFPTGWTEIQFRYEEPILHIDLEITTRSYPIQYYNYPLYQFEMR